MLRPLMQGKPALSGWGRTFLPGRETRSEDLVSITRDAELARGLGRSYGDASLPWRRDSKLVSTALADRILAFDETSGVLRAEAGLSLSEILRVLLPRGFFVPVTPGTKYVTLGGAVAADVHGKNHHVAGTIGRHVRALRLRVADGRIIDCSRGQEPELFFATLGGMGLTGHVLEVELVLERVPSPFIHRESFRFARLAEFLDALKRAGKQWPFTVGWIDTVATGAALGRGILYCGRWAEPEEVKRRFELPGRSLPMPFALPSGTLNRFTIGAFNQLIFHAHAADHKQDICDANTFFYPLDRVSRWNLAYGKSGVTQHQSVIPDQAGADGVRALIETLAESGACSFLTVIKDCGEQGEGLLSFPRPGMSMALDIPIDRRTQEVIDKLNERVLALGGRIYLAKDGFTRADHFRAMDPRVDAFLEVKRRWDPESKLKSAQSVRLFGEKP
jgi:decaprenylphospho-beta-D-ribofuranose 2-oxidase